MSEPVRLQEGEPAPDFTLPDQHGEPFRLSSTRGGRTILWFYGEAFTPACTKQACDFRDRLDAFAAAGYRVVGVSRDEPAVNARFAAEEGLSFPVLSDPERVVHEAYGTFGEKQMYGRTVHGVIRATFVIDAEGRIERALYGIKATGHVERLRRLLSV